MAVFMRNDCTYPDCHRNFGSLNELIFHIEDEHLDWDPATLEEREKMKSPYVPMSYILKFSSINQRETPVQKPSSKYESEIKKEEPILIESEISDDSWNDEYNTELGMMHMHRKQHSSPYYTKKENICRIKKFVCPIPGCNKRYKNINGIKYHTKNGHDVKKSPIKPRKTHKCRCGKVYKTIQGLKAHTLTHREAILSMHGNQSLYPRQMSSKAPHNMFRPYIRPDMMNSVINAIKNDIFDEDILTFSYLEQVPKLSDTVELDNNNFELLNSPFANNTFNFNENFAENSVEEQSNQNQNYSFSFTCRKF